MSLLRHRQSAASISSTRPLGPTRADQRLVVDRATETGPVASTARSSLIPVPAVMSGQLARILDRRIAMSGAGGSAEALTGAAVDELADLNRTATRRNLHATLGIAHPALAAAVDRGAELIDVQDVQRAAVEQLGR